MTSIWQAEGSPNIYYYGLAASSIVAAVVSPASAGSAWQAAVGFDGFGATHSGASDTNAHEIGHNHGRNHAPGCGASGASSFPYLDGSGRAIIGNAANSNYGFDLNSKTIYTFNRSGGGYFDFMNYCDPAWVSDFTYEALWQYDHIALAARSETTIADRSFLISGAIDPATSRVDFQPTYALNLPARLPDPGDYVLELIDAHSRVMAAYPFAAASATPDDLAGNPTATASGFHLTLPYVEGVSAIRVRRGDAILGSQHAGVTMPIVNAAQVRSGQLSWSGVSNAHYLVRASLDNSQTWEMIGFDLNQPTLDLTAARLSGQRVRFEIVASTGLESHMLEFGPVFVPEK